MVMEQVLELLADILEYPRAGMGAQVLECQKRAAAVAIPTEHLEEFRGFVEGTPFEKLEEIYAAAFDFSARWSPYVGYHLFGDGYARSAFLVGLRERYASRGFSSGSELADHISVMLRFVGSCKDASLRAELVEDALLPTVRRMAEDMQGSPTEPGSQYLPVLRTLETALVRG
jgi:nitrate reductase assembly molybdenum cofactor insertion protein NarJ